jgi:hypothetical protein
MDPRVLTVYKSPFPKKRLGKLYDGGYVIVDIPNVSYSLLLSGGIENDISFEEEFVYQYNVKCIAFDGTISKLPKVNNSIEFINKNIGFENTDRVTNLHEWIDETDNIFIKMDIEGCEVDWIRSLSDDQLKKFNQIVIEFHNPFSKKEDEMFNKLNKNHVLIHFHGNNCCGVISHKHTIIPKIFECTYINKKYFTNTLELNMDLIPSDLDMRNLAYHDDILIEHPPFVASKISIPSRFRVLNPWFMKKVRVKPTTPSLQ